MKLRILNTMTAAHVRLALLWFIFCAIIFLTGCGEQARSPVATLSISSDGRYVISTHYGRQLILWDIQKRTKKTLSRNANIFSPFFIPESHNFLWQNAKNNEVYVQSIEGKKIKIFDPGFQVFGHVITQDMKYYLASHDDWSFSYLNFKQGQIKLVKKPAYQGPGSSSLMTFSLQGSYLLTCGITSYDGQSNFPINLDMKQNSASSFDNESTNTSFLNSTVLWDLTQGKPIRKFVGTAASTVANLSPEAKYALAGDEQGWLFVWNTKTGKRIEMDEPTSPTFECHGVKVCEEEFEHRLKTTKVIPKDFYAHPWANFARTMNIKFIDEKGHFLRFIGAVNYATLYHLSSPKVIKYMHLGIEPQPDTFEVLTRSNVIDTAPKAKILVTNQSTVYKTKPQKGTGIIVYKFDPQTKTLKRLWAPDGPGNHRKIHNPNNPYEA